MTRMSRRFMSIALPTLLLGGLACLVDATAHAETTVLFPTHDNTLFQTNDGGKSSGSGNALFFGANSQSNLRRAVLAFDLSGIPAESIIDSVAFQIHVSQAPNDDDQVMAVHRLLGEFGEAGSVSQGGSGAPSEEGDATWLHQFYTDTFWTNAGGDFESIASAATTVGGVGSYTLKGAGLVSDVAFWLTSSEQSFGWLLQGDEAEASSARRIDSRESSEDSVRPQLTIHYTEPVKPVQRSTWGKIKAAFSPRGAARPGGND